MKLEQEQAGFLALLHEEGIVRQIPADLKTQAWNGRKWRSALYQLGFITPLLSGSPIRPFEATANGIRLAYADSVIKKQECFARSILAYRVPSPIERTHIEAVSFSPIRIVMKTLACLEGRGLKATLTIEEMASLVQFCKSEHNVTRLVQSITEYRSRRNASNNKLSFDREFRRIALQEHGGLVGAEALSDYADTNFRYLKATGLLSGEGVAIGIARDRRELVDQILSTADKPLSDDEYLSRLWDGAPLPTDNVAESISAIKALRGELESLGRRVELPGLSHLQQMDLEQIRLDLEERRRVIYEELFARQQRQETPEIVRVLSVLNSRKERSAAYAREAPAYLEWIVWRAFLAINSLVNQSWDVRQFQIGRDMLPLSPAPSRRPDLICEFADYVLVVEVTFTESARQDATEGEPVRRHVADAAIAFGSSRGKRVFGLFLAPTIDPNTAETFGRGRYVVAGKAVDVDIVPLTIKQFEEFFGCAFSSPSGLDPSQLRELIEIALTCRVDDGDAWKRNISAELSAFCKTRFVRST